MGRPLLSVEERERRKTLRLEARKKRWQDKKDKGICRDCDEKVSNRSKVFCDRHLENHRTTCKKSTVRYKENNKVSNRYSVVKCRAKKKGLEVCGKDESQYWMDFQDKKCYYCEITEDKLPSDDKKQQSLTIDRKDNSIGYNIDNMCLACFRCNCKKSAFFTEEEWMEICDKYVKPRLDEYHK